MVDVQHHAMPARNQANGAWRHLQCVRDLQVFVDHYHQLRRAFCIFFAAPQVQQLRALCTADLIVFERRMVAPMCVYQPLIIALNAYTARAQ
jgi:hypothetical protein